VHIAKIATGEINDEREMSRAAAKLDRKGGKKRVGIMSSQRRAEIAKIAAAARLRTH